MNNVEPFIDRITPGCQGSDPRRVIRGIGDDADVIDSGDGLLLVTTDMLVERVHFLRGTISFRQLGSKSLAVNLSDIAAMGGVPQEAFISIAIPATVSVEELDELYDGMKALARGTGVNLVGGNTTGSKLDLCINIAVTGSVPRGEILYRSGARIGDHILVTGTHGDSAGGLTILRFDPGTHRLVRETRKEYWWGWDLAFLDRFAVALEPDGLVVFDIADPTGLVFRDRLQFSPGPSRETHRL